MLLTSTMKCMWETGPASSSDIKRAAEKGRCVNAPPAEGYLTKLPETHSKLMTLIYSISGFYCFIIQNK